MKKVFICGVIAAAFGFTAVQAAPVGGSEGSQFTVTANLLATCQATNSGTQTIDFGDVAAFGAAPADDTVNLTFKCSLGLSPTATIDAGDDTVNGLTYTLTVGTRVDTPGTAATGNTFSFPVTGSMAGGQAGDQADSNTATRTLTIAF